MNQNNSNNSVVAIYPSHIAANSSDRSQRPLRPTRAASNSGVLYRTTTALQSYWKQHKSCGSDD